MQHYFQISKYFMLIVTGVFFVAALVAIGTPPRLALHTVAINIGTISLLISPVAAIATLVTGIASMRQVVDERNRIKRKTSEFQSTEFAPDHKRVEYILSQLQAEDRAYLEFYYAMRDEQANSRLSEDYTPEAEAVQRQHNK